MRAPNFRLHLIAALLASVALFSGCEDGSTQFGNSTASSAEAEESGEETGGEETDPGGSTRPEFPPTMGTADVDFGGFKDETFTLDEQTVVWLYVNNPAGDSFDIWLMNETERSAYTSAIAGLPASANPSDEAFRSSYGIELDSAYNFSLPMPSDLVAGKYYVVVDNTELGIYRTAPAGPISYEFGVKVNEDTLAASDESPLD